MSSSSVALTLIFVAQPDILVWISGAFGGLKRAGRIALACQSPALEAMHGVVPRFFRASPTPPTPKGAAVLEKTSLAPCIFAPLRVRAPHRGQDSSSFVGYFDCLLRGRARHLWPQGWVWRPHVSRRYWTYDAARVSRRLCFGVCDALVLPVRAEHQGSWTIGSSAEAK